MINRWRHYNLSHVVSANHYPLVFRRVLPMLHTRPSWYCYVQRSLHFVLFTYHDIHVFSWQLPRNAVVV